MPQISNKKAEKITVTVSDPAKSSIVKKKTKKADRAPKPNPKAKVERRTVPIVKNVIPQMIQELVDTIIMPGIKPTARWCNQFSQKKSAVAEPFQVVAANFGQANSSTFPEMQTSETFAALFRCPTRAVIQYDQNAGLAAMNYVALQTNPETGEGTSVSQNYLITVGDDAVPLRVPFAIPTLPYAPHGPILFAGSVSGSASRFLWFDKCDLGQITLSGSDLGVNTADVLVEIEYYGPDGFVNLESLPIAALSVTPVLYTFKTTTNDQGYYAIRVAALSATGGQNQFTLTATNMSITSGAGVGFAGSHFKHLPLPGYNQNAQAVDGCRVIGLDMCYTNTAPEIQLGGDVAMLQTGEDDNWFSYAPLTGSYAAISSKADSAFMNANKGMSGFLLPVDPKDMDYKRFLTFDVNNNIVDSNYPIDKAGSFLVQALNIPNAAGCVGHYTYRFAVEYLTTDLWRDLGTTRCTYAQGNEAFEILKYITQFHDNPDHLSDLWEEFKKGIKFVANGITEYGPQVLNLATKAAAFI